MRCEQCREALSARLDDEDIPAERAEAEAHLAGCSQCRAWLDSAARVNRLVRLRVAGEPPTLDEKVVAAAPGPGRARLAAALRAVLGVLGGLQLLLGLAEVSGSTPGLHNHVLAVATGATHLSNESAAWNVAVGAGFLWIALHRRRSAGLIPVLSAFVGFLALLSVNDYLTARVDPTRLLSHILLVAGYLITLALTRPGLDFSPPPSNRERPPWRWRVQFDEPEPVAEVPDAAPHHIPRQSAQRRAA
jgi:predicted anti-sigma-YlaC factor YlaD